MSDQTDTRKNEWLISGMIIYENTTYIVTVCETDLVLDCLKWAADLARQNDELAEVASTPEMRVMFEENARDLRLWAKWDTEFLETGRPLSSLSPALAARARLGNLKVGPANYENYMQGLMDRVVDAQTGATLNFVLIEPQSEPYGPQLYTTKDHEFLLRCATSGVICELISNEDLSNFYQRALTESGGASSAFEKGSSMDEHASRPSKRLRRTPKKRG